MAAIASLFLLLGAVSGCASVQTNSLGWPRALKECRTAEAVQLRFREGLVGPDTELVAKEQLAKELPVPVVLGNDPADGKKTFRIFFDGAEENFYDKNSFLEALIITAGKHAGHLVFYPSPISVASFFFSSDNVWAFGLRFGGLLIMATLANYGFIEGAVVATSGYFSHRSFYKKYGYLPYHFRTFSTFSDYALSFDEIKKKDRTKIPKYRYKLIEFPGAKRKIEKKDDEDEIIAASLEAWLQGLAADLNKHKIGSRAQPK